MLIGITLSGLPAVAMAYVSEEVDPKSIGLAMGLFIGGNAIGGMAGRIIGGVLTDLGSWRLAVGLIGAIGLVVGACRLAQPAGLGAFPPAPGRSDRTCCAPSASTCGTRACAPCSRRPSFSWAPS